MNTVSQSDTRTNRSGVKDNQSSQKQQHQKQHSQQHPHHQQQSPEQLYIAGAGASSSFSSSSRSSSGYIYPTETSSYDGFYTSNSSTTTSTSLHSHFDHDDYLSYEKSLARPLSSLENTRDPTLLPEQRHPIRPSSSFQVVQQQPQHQPQHEQQERTQPSLPTSDYSHDRTQGQHESDDDGDDDDDDDEEGFDLDLDLDPEQLQHPLLLEQPHTQATSSSSSTLHQQEFPLFRQQQRQHQQQQHQQQQTEQHPRPQSSHELHSNNFITEEEFLMLAEDYLLSLSPKKREKALLSNAMYQKILMVLLQPKNTQVSTAQFRFWAKKMFTLSTTATHHIVCHSGKPVATKECLYDVLVYCHRKSAHGGRDKTSAEARLQCAATLLLGTQRANSPVCEALSAVFKPQTQSTKASLVFRDTGRKYGLFG
ncbi:hypothetical protein BGZ93_010364 [Podila epicladia]|nr:hypothetical protein BGZ93_010364 [Podila epicladia]